MKTMNCTTIALVLLLAAGTSQAVWIGATNGTTDDDAHNYTNVMNWAGGVIDDDFSGVTLTGATTLYFTGDHATGANGLSTSYTGNYALTLRSSGGDRTLTLNGDVVHQPVSAPTLTFGATGTGNGLNLDLGGGNRTFYAGFDDSARRITIARGVLSNGGFVKAGRGQMDIIGTNPCEGPTAVNNYLVLMPSGSSIRNSPEIAITTTTSYTSQIEVKQMAGAEDRFGDEADFMFSTEGGGNYHATMQFYVSTANNEASETFGRIILRAGQGKFIHGIYNNQKNAFLTSYSSELVRHNRSVGFFSPMTATADTATYNNPGFGTRREGLGDYSCGNQMFFTTAPATVGGTGSRNTDCPVIPYLLSVDSTSNSASATPNTFMTYDAVKGLRAVRVRSDLLGNPPEVVGSIASANADGLDNVILAANETVNADATVNALCTPNRNLSLGSKVKLTVGSGIFNIQDGPALGGTDGILDAGTREGIIRQINFAGRTVTIPWSLAGSDGYTFAPFNGGFNLEGTNSYNGQTTLVCGTLRAYRKNTIEPNVSLPDDGLVLVHPAGTLQVGEGSTSDYRTHEIIGALAGAGAVRLGSISSATEVRRRALVIGEGGTGIPGQITLDGGVIAPGMTDEVGTLRITAEAASPNAGIPVTLTNGTFKVDIAGPGVCDVLSTLTNVNINAGGGLVVDVDVGSFQPRRGQEWTIIVSESGPITDGNGGKLLDAITDNSDRVNFTAAIALDGKSLVLTALDANSGSVIVVR